MSKIDMRFKLYTKFMLALVAISVVPVALVGVRLIGINQRGIQAAVLELHYKLAEKTSQNVENYLKSIDEKFNFAAHVLQKDMDWADKQALLQSLIETNREIKEISIVAASGREALKVFNPAFGEHAELSGHGNDRDFIKARDNFEKSVRMEPGSAGPRLVLYYPLVKGFLVRAEVVLSDLWGQIQRERVGGTGFALITDSSGVPLAYPAERFDSSALAGVKELSIVKDALKALSAGSSEYTDPAGVTQVGAYSPIPSIKGAVIIQQPRQEAYLAAYLMKRQAVAVVLLFGLSALVLAYLMSKQLSGPILQLTRKAELVAGGDFSQHVDIKSRDELRDLADTFNKMISQLKIYSDMQVDRIIAEQKKTDAILFSIADGIIMTDYQGKIALANRRARAILGLKEGAVLEGQVLTDLLPDPNIRAVLEELSRNPKEGVFRDFEISTGQVKQVYKCFSLPVFAPEKHIDIGVVTALQDVTFERELARIKEEFLHSITHDLRNPMGAIRGFLEFLLKEVPGPLNDAQKKMLMSMDRASFRLLGMINNILDVAKMEVGKFEMKLSETRVNEVAARVIELLQSLAQRKNIKLEVDSPSPVSAHMDSELIERVLTNLIGNAIKFTPEDGRITVHLLDGADKITACVENTGEGIPQEYISKIFEKFEQVKGQKGGGTGLGLTICKYIVSGHMGKIWVESEPGKGSRFYFSIPKNLAKNEADEVVMKQS